MRAGSGAGLECAVLRLCFGAGRDLKCNAGDALGRAAAMPVDDQRGKRGGVGGVVAHEVSIRITTTGVAGR